MDESVFVQDVRRWIGDGYEALTSEDIEAAAHALGTLGSAPRQVAGYLIRLRLDLSHYERAERRPPDADEPQPNAAPDGGTDG